MRLYRFIDSINRNQILEDWLYWVTGMHFVLVIQTFPNEDVYITPSWRCVTDFSYWIQWWNRLYFPPNKSSMRQVLSILQKGWFDNDKWKVVIQQPSQDYSKTTDYFYRTLSAILNNSNLYNLIRHITNIQCFPKSSKIILFNSISSSFILTGSVDAFLMRHLPSHITIANWKDSKLFRAFT